MEKVIFAIAALLTLSVSAGEIEFSANQIKETVPKVEYKPEIRIKAGAPNQYTSVRFFLADGREAGSLTCHESHSHCSFYVYSTDQAICNKKTAPCNSSIIDIDFGDKPKVNIEVPLVLRGTRSGLRFRGQDGNYYEQGVDASGKFYVKRWWSNSGLGPNLVVNQ